MDKNIFIQLAKDAYRLTLLFPGKEPLRFKIREIANDIVAGFIIRENDYLGHLRSQVEVMDSFLEIAMEQDWTSPAKIKEVKDSYIRVDRMLDEERSLRKKMADVIEKEEKTTNFVLIEEEVETQIIEPLPRSVMEPVIPAKPMVVPVAEKAKEPVKEEPDEEEDDEDTTLTGSQILRQNRILEFLKEKGGAQVWEIQKIFPSVSKRTIRRDFRSMLKQGLIERTGEHNTAAYKLKITLS